MPPKKRKEEEDINGGQKKTKIDDEAENGKTAEADEERPKIENNSPAGELLFCGGTNWDLIGRKTVPKGVKDLGGRNLNRPHRLGSMLGVKVRTIASGCIACHSIIVTTEGKAYSWGRNEYGQLGHGDKTRREEPKLIESLKDLVIIDAACGKNHSLVLSDAGDVYSFGENKMGQLGLNHKTPYIPSPTCILHKGPAIHRIAAGADFSMMVDVRGNLFSFGSPEYGQLGHNNDGKYFLSSTKMGFDCELKPRRVQLFFEKTRDGQMIPVQSVEITDISCGANHTLAVDHNKRLYSWGFGGYGRLGHAEPKDELVPRLIKVFDSPNHGAVQIQAGSQFCLAVNESGMLYMWGQSRSAGEATMYPKPVQDLNGWNIRSIGCCNRSIVVAADDSLVSWGPSPTYGELGYGDSGPKSSTVAKEVRTVDGVYIMKVKCGFAHTLLLARDETEEDKENIEKLPVFTPTVG